MGVKRIVVGTDGSEHALRAVAWAAELAAQTGAEVTAAHAVGLLVDTPSGPVPGWQLHDRLRQLLEGEWTEALRTLGVELGCRLEAGSPVTALLRVAEEEDADLVVVGSRGAGGFSELHLGSTSHQVALYAHRPVTIVPPLGRARPGGVEPTRRCGAARSTWRQPSRTRRTGGRGKETTVNGDLTPHDTQGFVVD